MRILTFKTTSRHISQLGRELVTDFVTALVELIKNAYDADAYGVRLLVENVNTPKSKIVLVDTGSGMTRNEFENKWMVIGTNSKVAEPYTPKGRKKAGKKGIGRFSVERLAEKVTIYSFPSDESPFKVSINWNSFEGIDVNAIKQRIDILRNKQDHAAAKYICNQLDYFLNSSIVLQTDKDTVQNLLAGWDTTYTSFYLPMYLDILENHILTVFEKYTDTEQLVEDIESVLDNIDDADINNPFNVLNNVYTNFKLDSTHPTGMVLVLEGLRDEWKQKDIDKLQKELRLLVAPNLLDSDPFHIEFAAPEFQIENLVLINDILKLHYARVEGKIYNSAKSYKITYVDKEGIKEEIEWTSKEPLLCGDLEIEIYYFLRESNSLSDPDSGYNFTFAKKVLDTYCGIKIYRDNFRVKPYGDIGNDWLLLDQRKVSDTHSYLVGNNQVVGTVRIGDIQNPLLIDSTNREGIIENEAFDQLCNFVVECTNLISSVRRNEYEKRQREAEINQIEAQNELEKQYDTINNQYSDSSFIKKIHETLENRSSFDPVHTVDEIVNLYIEDSEQKRVEIEKLYNNYNKHYNDTKERYEETINLQQSDLNLYKNLASLGMLTGSFGHETSDIVSRIQANIHLINHYLNSASNIDLARNSLENVDTDFLRIKAYSNLIVDFLRKRKRENNVTVDCRKVLTDICNLYQNIVESYAISIRTEIADGTIEYNMKQIDLESIIINMITNSFEQVKGRKAKTIGIELKQSISHVLFSFEDTGPGVPFELRDAIFHPFKTTKEDGIGLGLNIVKDIVANYDGTITIGDSVKYGGACFSIAFPKESESV